jgi:hypothetical protein
MSHKGCSGSGASHGGYGGYGGKYSQTHTKDEYCIDTYPQQYFTELYGSTEGSGGASG